MAKRGTPAFFLVFWAHSKAVSLNTKNGEEGHRAFFLSFLWRAQKRCHSASKMKKRGTPAFFLVFWARSKAVSFIKNEAHRALVKHGNARAGECHQLVGHQMNEQVRHRAVQALEGEPGKVARAGADTTQRHLGHALGGKAGNEAVAQVAHAADVDSTNLSSCLAAPMGATSCPRLAILEPASLSQKVTNAPMSFVKARATVTLCSATPFGTLDCCVCTVG